MSFIQAKSDYCMFTLKKAATITVVLIYVDDQLIYGDDEAQIDYLKDILAKSFHMKD